MAYTFIQPSSNPEVFRDQLVQLVNERFDFSEKFFFAVRQKLPRLYDVWRGIYTGRYHPHKNNVHVPLIYAAIWSDAARKASASLDTDPIVTFRGYGPDDKGVALRHEQLVSAQFQDAEAYVKEVTTHVLAGMYGVSISNVMWDRRKEYAVFDEWQSLPLSTERVRSIRTAQVTTFDGPNYDITDRLDFYPQPGPRTIPKMSWCGRRYYLDLDDLRFMSSGDRPVFDPMEVARLEREGVGADKTMDDVVNRRYMARLGMSDDMSRIMDKFSRPCEIREYWGIIPSEYAIRGETNVVITIANRRYLLRARGNPFWHRKKPFVAHSPNPDPHYFDAPGKAEVAEKLQLTANRYVNQRLDAADIVIDPMWFYDRNSGINTDTLYARPGLWIGTDGPPNDKVWPMPIDLRGLQAGAGMTQEMMAYIERATGITDDTVAGLQSQGNQTAREFVGRREAAGSRLMLESRLYEKQYLEPLANFFVQLNRQFLEGPVEFNIIGDNAEKDADTGLPNTDTRGTLEGYELAVNYQARAIGATSNLSRLIRRQELIPLLQAVSNNQFAAGAVNFVNFLRQIFREFDLDNVNELIQQQAAANPALQSIMSNANIAPGANPSAIPDTSQGAGAPMALAQFLGAGAGGQ